MEYSQHQDSETIPESQKYGSSDSGVGFDPTLYLVINPDQCANNDPVKTALEAVRGGVTAVQIRCKQRTNSNLVTLCEQIAEVLSPFDATVFVNDRVDVASAAQIEGVHLGQSDTPVSQARDRLEGRLLIGLTVRSLSEAKKAQLSEIDYISIGGVFQTRSKSDAGPPIGLENLSGIYQEIRSQDSTIPIIAISGIDETNVNSVIRIGVDGIAVISAICESPDPRGAAQKLRSLIDHAAQRGRSS